MDQTNEQRHRSLLLRSCQRDTHRKGMYDLWKTSYNNTTFTEQRICDQKRIIFQKAENALNQTLRANWLTQAEIEAIRSEIYTDTEEDEEDEENSIQPDIQDDVDDHQHQSASHSATM